MGTTYAVRGVTGIVLCSLLLALPANVGAQIAPPPPGSVWTATVDVPAQCTVNDSDGVAHSYTGFLGICALQKTVESGAISSVSLSNAFPALGLFVTAIGGVAANPASEYWALYQNGSFALVGVTQMTVSAGDTILFELHDFADAYLGSSLTITVNSLVSSPSVATTTPSGSGIKLIASDFDVAKAVAFLVAEQQEDGSMPTWLLSDWTAFALASYGPSGARDKLRDYLKQSTPGMTNVTDYERHAMALLSLGINPYVGAGADYITPIVAAFDGAQVGDPVLVNDDIFAVFPLLHAGYLRDPMLESIKGVIVRAQKADGSWEGSVDLTAAAVQALALFDRTLDVERAIDRAEGYLASQQKEDGGFGNSFSTAWAMQAISAMGDSHTTWTKALYHTPRYYLSELQQKDGGVEPADAGQNARLWATAYAVPGVLGKTWDSILASFPKPPPPTPPTATTTPEIATTSAVATSVSDTASGTAAESATQEGPALTPDEILGSESEAPATTADQVAAVGSIEVNEFAWGIAALVALITIIAVIYSLLRGRRRKPVFETT